MGLGAAAAGAGLALWPHDAPEAVDRSVWALRFPKPGGGEIALADFRGKPLLLNFWATWCPPCVTEMPLLSRFQSEHRARGWQVLGLAVDQEAPVRAFLAEQGVDFPIGLAGATGLDLARTLGNNIGGLPFSVAFDADGAIRKRKIGALDLETLTRWGASLV